jgi:DNA-directed RNA polymerase subunit L
MKMVISKKNKSSFQIEFNGPEVKTLGDIEEFLLVKPEHVIQTALEEALRKGLEGTEKLLDEFDV